MNQHPKLSLLDALAGGDCLTGLKSVIEAVVHGKFIADQFKSIFIEENG